MPYGLCFSSAIQPTGQLPFGWCGNNLGLVVNEIVADGSPKEFEVTIAVEAPGEGACRTTKEPYCRKVRVREKVFKSKCPVIPGSLINQDKRIAEAANQEAVPKSNIHVHGVKVFVLRLINRTTTVCFPYGCVRTQGRGEFTTIQPFTATADLNEVFVISKLATTHDAMKFLQLPVLFCIRLVGGTTPTNQWDIDTHAMHQFEDSVTEECGE